MMQDFTTRAFVDTRRQPGLVAPLAPSMRLTTSPIPPGPFAASRSTRLSQLLRRFTMWAVGSVALALALDVLVRHLWPGPDVRLDLALIAAITVPLLLLGGQLFVRQALQQERALHWQQARHWLRARHDALVWADNRLAFGEAVQQLNRQLPGLRAGLFLLDLHDFQRINDACGHSVGDQVLRETGRRLRAVLQAHVAGGHPGRGTRRRWSRPRLVRVGSDEFACWLPLWTDADDARRLAQAMLDCLDAPFAIGSMRLHLNGNVGYVIGTIDQPGLHRGQEWLTRANAAVQRAKALGAGQLVAFADEQLSAMVRRHEVHQALERALHSGQGLRLLYQPIVSVHGGGLVGCEALMRWQHPEWGPVSPVEFIPVAEGSDLIRPLGRWVLAQGIRQLAQWRSDPALPGAPHMRLSINLSRAQLLDTELVAFVQDQLAQHRVPPHALCLEVTESLPLDDLACVQVLQALHGVGVALALDDFGTGYSSLSALLNLPLNSVKIDRQFISGIDNCAHRQSLVAAVLRVAQGMQLNVVAEGIEQTAEADTLQRLGCHHMQGWLISQAVDAEVVATKWLRQATPAARAPDDTPAEAMCHETDCGHARFGRCPAVATRAAPVTLPTPYGV